FVRARSPPRTASAISVWTLMWGASPLPLTRKCSCCLRRTRREASNDPARDKIPARLFGPRGNPRAGCGRLCDGRGTVLERAARVVRFAGGSGRQREADRAAAEGEAAAGALAPAQPPRRPR